LRRALQRGGRPAAAAAAPLRHALVVVELALAVILVTGAGLMIDTVGRLHRVDLGVDTDGVLTFALGLPQARYGTPAEITAFWDRFVEELEGIPRVEAAGLTSRQPLVGGTNGTMVLSSEPDIEPTAETLVEIRTVSPGYFDAVGMQLTRGRMLGPADRGAGGGVLVNEAFVRRRLGDDDPLRESLRPLWLEQSWPIVGVVSDSREFGPTEPARPTAYWLIGTEAMGIRSYMYAALRTSRSPTAVVPQVRERLMALDRDIPVVDIATLDEIADQRVGRNRQSALSLLSVFAGVALLLAAIGTYGVISFSVGTRAREIGVRMALGATGGGVARLILRQGLWIAALGVASGMLASLLTGRLLTSMLWQASPTDPTVLLGVVAVLLATALLACWLPARRAARLEVVDILRRD
jgi:predicted permease